jgi:hypothetical protein
MASREPTEKRPPKKRGPDPEALVLEGPWEKAVEKALKVKPEEKKGRAK